MKPQLVEPGRFRFMDGVTDAQRVALSEAIGSLAAYAKGYAADGSRGMARDVAERRRALIAAFCRPETDEERARGLRFIKGFVADHPHLYPGGAVFFAEHIVVEGNGCMIPALLLIAFGTVLLIVEAFIVTFRLGVRRGRELEKMEPPVQGVMHFKDGHVWEVRADSATEAVERVAHIGWRKW